MLAGNAKFWINQLLGCDTSQTYNNFRSDQRHLVAQIIDTGFLLRLQRIPVPGRAAFDNIGNITVLFPVQINDGQHIIQQFPCRTDKRKSLQILLLTWTFSDEQNVRIFIADTENHIPSARMIRSKSLPAWWQTLQKSPKRWNLPLKENRFNPY